MTDNTILLWATVLVVFVVAFLLLYHFFMSFNTQRNYIKIEMKRSTGREYRHWKKELKKLYLRKLPLIGRLFKK